MTAGRKVNTLSQSWCTPPKYVNAIKKFWNGTIDLDPCSNEYSIVKAITEFKLPEIDGLKEEWNFKTIYVNPPYGADRERGTTIKDWLGKCVLVAPNTTHWKKFIFGKADAICFLYDTRLRFLVDGIDSGKGAPMACCIIYWGKRYNSFFEHFIEFGAVIDLSHLKNKNIGNNNCHIPSLFDIL